MSVQTYCETQALTLIPTCTLQSFSSCLKQITDAADLRKAVPIKFRSYNHNSVIYMILNMQF